MVEWFSNECGRQFHNCTLMGGKVCTIFVTNGKPNQNQQLSWLHAFSHAGCQLHVFALNSTWSIALFSSLMIDQSNYFGFGFAIANEYYFIEYYYINVSFMVDAGMDYLDRKCLTMWHMPERIIQTISHNSCYLHLP